MLVDKACKSYLRLGILYTETHAAKNSNLLHLEEPSAAGYEANRAMHNFSVSYETEYYHITQAFTLVGLIEHSNSSDRHKTKALSLMFNSPAFKLVPCGIWLIAYHQTAVTRPSTWGQPRPQAGPSQCDHTPTKSRNLRGNLEISTKILESPLKSQNLS